MKMLGDRPIWLAFGEELQRLQFSHRQWPQWVLCFLFFDGAILRANLWTYIDLSVADTFERLEHIIITVVL